MSRIRMSVVFCLLGLYGLPASGQVVGWRSDGTGRCPDAQPILEWSKEKNVLWKTPLEKWSNATPILVGERIFVCEEPDVLVCLARKDGRILWKKATPLTDLLSEDEKAEMKRLKAVHKKLQPMLDEERKTRRARNEAKKKLDASPEDDRRKEQFKQWDSKLKAIGKELSPRRKDMKRLAQYTPPRVHAVNGYTSMTPTSDGQGVYVVFGTGVVAGYDLEGNRLWARRMEKPTMGYGISASPLLVGEVLVAHLNLIWGLDKSTGETRWKTPSRVRYGSPVHARIGERDVAITAGGDFVDISDGSILAKKVANAVYNAPVVHDGVAYFVEHGGKALQLSGTTRGKIDPKLGLFTKH